MKTIILISDTHGNTKIIDEILSKNKYDIAICAGDYTCSQSFVNQRFDFVVRGNNDFDTNPDELYFEIENIKFYLQHGHLIGSYWQLDNYEFMKKVLDEKNVDVLIHGHTHVSKIFEYENGIVINPGSTTYPRGNSNKSFGKITIENGSISCEIIEIDI